MAYNNSNVTIPNMYAITIEVIECTSWEPDVDEWKAFGRIVSLKSY